MGANSVIKDANKYSRLFWPQVTETLTRTWLLVPVGAIEQHGPHLPLDVDCIIPEALCNELSRHILGLVAPLISYGARSIPSSGGGPSYPGTIRIRGKVLIGLYEDIITEFTLAGARRVLLLNGHFENEPLLIEAAERCREKGILEDSLVVVTSWWSLVSPSLIQDIFGDDFPGWHAEHAGQTETALLLHLAPERVGNERVDHPHQIRAGVYCHPVSPDQVGTKGVLSHTSSATAEMGKALFDHLIMGLVSMLQDIGS